MKLSITHSFMGMGMGMLSWYGVIPWFIALQKLYDCECLKMFYNNYSANKELFLTS